ncbi:hypothetical protein [Methylobrevis pamukkalensis]|uniref:GcrA cell cycle regulator n=1 Tax=Methylobrevis pamukkalensis TaxID=1439726 RepID=A0A1E3H349_9HYPH|nr:hypothetical protein [Methylobrevis pamukkalensis]ODN70748.1 hypothetical protein A6302_01908 [Methylobrevis pamukkalensis]
MSDPVEMGPGWTPEAVHRFVALAREGATAEVISLKLQKPVTAVRSKAAELGLALKAA